MKAYSNKEYSFEDAAHLLRRAGFGGTPAEVEELRKLGPKLAVEKLLLFSKDDGTNPNPHKFRVILEAASGNLGNARGKAINVLQGWWLHKMLTTSQPLKEKLTLFWHGHFATGLDKVRNPFMLEQQNELFRSQGLSRFDDLVLEVSRDPAMLMYLDNAENVKGHPNENYARELMELFTMGVHGGYTERDVQESARAFTGWGLEKPPKGNIKYSENPKFKFFANKHDDGQKTFLEERGNFNGSDIVRMTTQHPSTARFITGKLWQFFVSEELPKATADELVKLWQDTGANIREVLRTILTSEKFYAPENRSSLVKSPIEYVVGALRSSAARPTAAQTIALVNQLDAMAQIPLHPPNVKGWDGGLEWIADGTVLARLNFMGALVGGKLPGRDPSAEKVQVPAAPIPNLSWPIGSSVSETIDLIGRHYLGTTPTGSLRKALEGFAKDRNTPDVARRLAHLVLVSPQYQVA
jgi:uncharacterized protein (DUF1800 family)